MSEPITPTELAELERLEQAAAPGDWKASCGLGDDLMEGVLAPTISPKHDDLIAMGFHQRVIMQPNWNFPEQAKADMEFTAAIRNVARRLFTALRKQQESIWELEEMVSSRETDRNRFLAERDAAVALVRLLVDQVKALRSTVHSSGAEREARAWLAAREKPHAPS